MRLRFWGTRGSIAAPGPGTNHYGGNTSCIQLTTHDGKHVVLDCGTGARLLGNQMIADATGPISASILLTHTHWDHTPSSFRMTRNTPCVDGCCGPMLRTSSVASRKVSSLVSRSR